MYQIQIMRQDTFIGWWSGEFANGHHLLLFQLHFISQVRHHPYQGLISAHSKARLIASVPTFALLRLLLPSVFPTEAFFPFPFLPPVFVH